MMATENLNNLIAYLLSERPEWNDLAIPTDEFWNNSAYTAVLLTFDRQGKPVRSISKPRTSFCKR